MRYSRSPVLPFLKAGLRIPGSLLFLLSALFVSCGPSIHSFQVDQQTVTSADSIQVNWKVSGKPTLLIHEKERTGKGDAGTDGGKFLELTLVAQKNGKEKRQFIQVIVLPEESVDTIVFPISSLHGDTLVAAGEKNNERWGEHFQIGAITSASGRPLIVTHAGKTANLNGQDPDTVTFRGIPNSGPWEIRTLETAAEKSNPATTPSTLRLRTQLVYKKQ